MPPFGLQRMKGRIDHLFGFVLRIFCGEIKVGGAGHDKGVCFYSFQCLSHVSVEAGVITDVAAFPGMQHSKQVIGILLQVIRFPKV